MARRSGHGEAPPAATPTASWRAFALVALALLIGQGSLSLVGAALPLYLADLGAATARIGIEVGVSNVVAIGGTLLIGPVINRFGAHRLLSGGMGCYLVASIGLLALPGEALAVACRAVQGLGSALVMPSVLTMAPQIVPLKPGTALGVVGALSNLTLAVYPPLGLWLYGRGGGDTLFLAAIVCAACGLLAGILVPRPPRVATPARGFGFDRRWLAGLGATGLFLAYFGGLLAYLPLALAHPGAPNAGLFFTADAIGVMLLRVPSGILVDRFGPRVVQACGIAVTLVGIGVLALTPSAATLLVSGILTGVGAGFFVAGMLVSLANRSGDHNRGTAMALSTASLNIGLLAGSALSGPLYGPGGLGAVLLLGTATTLATLPLVVIDRERAAAAP